MPTDVTTDLTPGLVTIGMTIYNEARWLRQSLDALLAQTFTNYELLILDNCSTDGTSDIAAEYAARDPRIRHIRHETNLGGNESYHRAVQQARGEYFLFAAGHDLWSPNYIEVLHTALEQQPRAVITFGRGVFIDEDNIEQGAIKGHYSTEGVRSPVRRFNVYMWANQDPVYGLTRTEALRKTRTNLQVVASGQVLLQELAILGEFSYVHDAVFKRRITRAKENREQRRQRYHEDLLQNRSAQRLPYFRCIWHIGVAAWRTEVRGKRHRRTRLKLLMSTPNAIVRFWELLIADLRHLFS